MTDTTATTPLWHRAGWIVAGLCVGALAQAQCAVLWGALYPLFESTAHFEKRMGYRETDSGYFLDIPHSNIDASEYGYIGGEDEGASRWQVVFRPREGLYLQVDVSLDEDTGGQFIDTVYQGGKGKDEYRIGMSRYEPAAEVPGTSWHYRILDQRATTARYWEYFDFNQDGALDLVREEVNSDVVASWVVVNFDWYAADPDDDTIGSQLLLDTAPDDSWAKWSGQNWAIGAPDLAEVTP